MCPEGAGRPSAEPLTAVFFATETNGKVLETLSPSLS